MISKGLNESVYVTFLLSRLFVGNSISLSGFNGIRTGVHEIAGRYEMAGPPQNLTLERFSRNSKLERQSNMTKIETPHNIV
jgi:hypothetical protein